jgi:ABC-type multidrug transport system ATPase subunit
VDSIPSGWRWLNTISFEKNVLKGLAVNEMYNLKWTCNPGETLIPEIDSCQLVDGHDALQLYDMDVSEESEKRQLLLNEFYFYLIFNAIAALAMAWPDWSVTDTSELPNWNQQEIKKKNAPATASSSVTMPMEHHQNANVNHSSPPPTHQGSPAPMVYIAWNNLTYVVDIPKNNNTNVPSSSADSAPTAIEGKGDIEMGEVKTINENVVEQLVDDAPGKRTLLKDVYGYAKPGMMVALMGGSGAGKTTLLDVLAGKKTGGDIINDALVNGKPRDKSFSRIAGYVEQFDSHDELSTIREAIEFSAMLRLPSEMSYEDKIGRVEEVIQTLRLSHVQQLRIGGTSPEIRKKVTIAVELVMNPGLLFLDEPTTGLDSAGALAVMHAVRSLSTSITVICTIHQPSIEIVNCFSHVLLMNKWEQRGRVAYFGAVKDMPSWFGTHGLGQFVEGSNIAEFGLESLQVAGKNKVNAASLFLQSVEGKQVINDITNGIVTVSKGSPLLIEYSTYATGFMTQVSQVTKRFFWNNTRNGPLILSRYLLLTVTALVISILFFNSPSTQKGASNRISIMFLCSSFPVFTAFSVLPDLVGMRPLYFRFVPSLTFHVTLCVSSHMLLSVSWVKIGRRIHKCIHHLHIILAVSLVSNHLFGLKELYGHY